MSKILTAISTWLSGHENSSTTVSDGVNSLRAGYAKSDARPLKANLYLS